MAHSADKIDETYDQLDNLESLCELFFGWRRYTIYKNISGTLRILLTGSSGQVGLIQTVLPKATLGPLKKIPDPATPQEYLVLPAAVRIQQGEASIQLGNGTITTKILQTAGSALDSMTIDEMFDASSLGLPLLQWLDQAFLRPNWTLRKFIGTVANKDGGAHHDPNDIIRAMQRFGHLHWPLTSGIARSILPQLREQMMQSYPHHVRPLR